MALPLLGMTRKPGSLPLIRAYIGQGLRTDLERFESETIAALISSLKRPIARLNTWPNDEQDAIAPSLLNLVYFCPTT